MERRQAARPSARRYVETWTRQPGFALAYTSAPVAETFAALRSPSSRGGLGWTRL